MKNFSILLCLLWMGFIFYMSSNTGMISHQESTKVVTIVKNTEAKLQNKPAPTALPTNKNAIKVQQAKEKRLDTLVRKNAHAFMYMVLAFLISNLFFVFNKQGKASIIYILFICLFYAVTDEFHQSFVPGRGSLVSDVLIDFGGALIGLAFYYLAYYNIYKRAASK